MISCASILVAVDFSAASDKALLYGRELSRLMCAKLHVIHVVGDMVAASLMTPADHAGTGRAHAAFEQSAHQRLRALIEDGADQDASPTIVVRKGSSPAAEILDYVKEQPIGLVVVGSHGQSAAEHVPLGSVAEQVVRLAACPVLTVRTWERDFIQPTTLPAAG